jgi:NAD(P)-dependent dehydrogenase (short-subunit alcohol dehydrogenase family)
MRRFDDKVVLITGAASGIGRATAERLAEEGAVVVCADVQAEALAEAAKRARELGAEAHAIFCDVSNPEQVSALVRETVERFGALHSLCNSAGILSFGHAHEYPLEEWDRILSVNLTGTFLMCRAAIPHLLQSGGNIVNMASTAALTGHPWTCAYSASKGGVLALTRGIAVEYGRQGLRANAICPGSVTTPMHNEFSLPEGADATLLQRILPLDKSRGPETVAGTVAFLASDEAAHINGVALRVDGAALT